MKNNKNLFLMAKPLIYLTDSLFFNVNRYLSFMTCYINASAKTLTEYLKENIK